ncbi:prolactin-7D1-like [Arvicola amphibius]|uniref:prolactin-7D1-like n=1 Tax=Arvicola amphibius TaxID=1047088 RepID=UPI001C09D4B0|nr:prolactin-7D1-like [Arvicola amphibius]
MSHNSDASAKMCPLMQQQHQHEARTSGRSLFPSTVLQCRSYQGGRQAEILSLLITSNEEFSAELCFCIAGTFPMLLLSNLLLWEGMASAPMNISDAGLSEVSLKDLLENAIILAENISDLATDMRLEFFEDLLNMILLILRDWKDPLKHQVTQLGAMPGVPDVILSMAKAIEDQHKIFLEHIMKIVPKVNPAIQENEDSPVWSPLGSLQTTDERIQVFALYMFSLCLQLDLQIVEYYLRLLKCLHINGDICFFQSRGTP